MYRAVSEDDAASSFKSAFRTLLFVESCSGASDVLATKGTSCGGGGMTKPVL